MASSIVEFIEAQRELVENLEIEMARAVWIAGLESTPEAEELVAQASAAVDMQYANSDRYAELKSFKIPDNPDLQRQALILHNEFAQCQISGSVIEDISRREAEIDGIFANFRADIHGKQASENDIRDILRDSNDNDERKTAWSAGKQIGAIVAPKLLELVKIRNREAKNMGYDNYYSMRMILQELDESQLFDTLERVSSELEPAFLRRKAKFDAQIAKRFNISVDELRPWHYNDPFFQEAPTADDASLDQLFEDKNLEDILLRSFSALGLRIESLVPMSDLYERPGKNQHAYCLQVGRGRGEVRVLCNLRPTAKWMGTLLHEFGHAIYDFEISNDLPFFLKNVSHIMTTEAIAELMGRFVTNPSWLKRWADVPDEQIDIVGYAASETEKTRMVVFTQWVQVITHFERELYLEPTQNLDRLWWELVAKYQHLTPPDEPLPGAWASKIHFSNAPVYYHNYLMGEMIASQLLHTLRTTVVQSEAELVDSPKVGEFLIEKFFRPGARYAWNDLVKHATGEYLNPSYFIDEMSS